jgi:hypothetical protein
MSSRWRLPRRRHTVTQPDKSSEVQRNPHSDEIWISDPSNLEQLWNLLAIPPLPGYAPAAITAVAVAMSPDGGVARYPLYAQLSAAELSEPFEVHIAIETLRNWMRTQRFT